MAKSLIVGNWKSYINSLKEGKKLFKDIEKGLPRQLNTTVVVCPPSLLLHPLAHSYSGKRIAFGVQDIFYETGAHTGETAVPLAKNVGARYVIVGHAERRAQGESDEVVAREVGAILDCKLTPIIAFGESSRDAEGHYLEDLKRSIVDSLALVDQSSFKKVILAYEPVWAIGAPLPPSPRIIRESVIFLRKTLAERFGREAAMKAHILYGGAVTAEGAKDIAQEGGTNGLLLGRASVNAAAFTAIIHSWEN